MLHFSKVAAKSLTQRKSERHNGPVQLLGVRAISEELARNVRKQVP